MSTQELTSPRGLTRGPLAEPFPAVCFALCFAHAVYLAASYAVGAWIVDGGGRAIPTDFLGFWSAGRLVVDGIPAAAYNESIHKGVSDSFGYFFEGTYPWHYPPPILLAAAAAALLPYGVAHVAWVLATFPLYALAIRSIVAHRIGWLVAGAFPAVIPNIITGQNGFLTTALIGGTLGLMERSPVLAGCCLGVLTYKPQFGLLFPLALIAGRRWTVFWSATAVAILLALVSWLAFGVGTWEAFLQALPASSQVVLAEGRTAWGKLQSLYGLVRLLGGGATLAWTLQGALTVICVMAIVALWRGKAPFTIKAAALATGALLATPYAFIYDLAVLAVPVALLIRMAVESGFRPGEPIGLAAAVAFLTSFPFVHGPVGLAASLIVAAMIARRWLEWRRAEASRSPSAFAHRPV